MHRAQQHPGAGTKGAALIEFAVVLPVLLTFVVGIIDYGYILRDAQFMAQASRAGARAASRLLSTATPTCDELKAEATVQARNLLSGSTTMLSNFIIEPVIFSTIVNDSASFVVVTVSIRRPTLSFFAGSALTSSLHEVRIGSSFRVEKPVVCA